MSENTSSGIHCNLYENVFAPARNADFLVNILEYVNIPASRINGLFLNQTCFIASNVSRLLSVS